MKIFRLDGNCISLKPNLQYALQSHLIAPFPPPQTTKNSPLVIVVPETPEVFARRGPLVIASVGTSLNSSRDQPAVGTMDMAVSGLIKGKIIYFQQLEDQRLHW